jgi:hypothetical protein
MMKRLVLFLGLIAFFAISEAQYVKSTRVVRVPEKVGYGYYVGSHDNGDTAIYGTTWDVVFSIELAAKSRYTISHVIIADTLETSTGNVTIQLYGSYDDSVYTAVGSAITWSAGSAVYGANVNLNTYSSLASGTITDAAHVITTIDSLLYDDTLHVAAQIYTDARTVTTTLPGTDYRFIKFLFTAASGGTAEITYVGIKVTPIQVPW